MGEKLLVALMNTLMGMGTVFVVLIFISFIISLFVYVPSLERKLKNRNSDKKRKKKTGSPDEEPAPQRPVLTAEEEELLADEYDDGELIAVIMAAIVASEGGAVSADRLVVRSIRRVKERVRR